jgi:hypothetical protein
MTPEIVAVLALVIFTLLGTFAYWRGKRIQINKSVELALNEVYDTGVSIQQSAHVSVEAQDALNGQAKGYILSMGGYDVWYTYVSKSGEPVELYTITVDRGTGIDAVEISVESESTGFVRGSVRFIRNLKVAKTISLENSYKSAEFVKMVRAKIKRLVKIER